MADFDLSQDGNDGAVALRVLVPYDLSNGFELSVDALPDAVALNAIAPFEYKSFELAQDGTLFAVALYMNVWPWFFDPSVMTVYKMRGEDAVTNGLYDTWLSIGAPDYSATKYSGALATPLRDVIVIDYWSKLVSHVAAASVVVANGVQ